MSAFLRKYGTAATVDGVPLITRDAVDFKASPTLEAGDVLVSKNGGAYANITTLPTVSPSGGYSLKVSLSATEMQSARISVIFVDQSVTKEWEDQEIIIETFGNASAQYLYDFSLNFVNAILDEVNTGATHNVTNSVARQIRTAGGGTGLLIRSGTAQAGSTSNTIKLDTGASASNNIYNGSIILLTGGTGAGQTRKVISYNGTTKVATVDKVWIVTPDATTTFEMYGTAGSLASHEGTAQTGGTSTITLESTASASDDIYNGALISIFSGTGSGQTRVIQDYVGSTRVATVDADWDVQPDNTSVYAVIPSTDQISDLPTFPTVGDIATGVWESTTRTLTSFGTLVADIWSNVTRTLTAAVEGTGIDTLLSRLTESRAGYLDNLNIGGLVAGSDEVTSIQNNTLAVRVVPSFMQKPASGDATFRLEIYLYDTLGEMEAPDSAPTLSVVNNAGESRDSGLDDTTMALVSTGRYRAEYTITNAHELEQLVFLFTVVEGGNTRVYANGSQVVDAVAVDFTAEDRTTLQTIQDAIGTDSPGVDTLLGRLTLQRATNLDNLDESVATRASQDSVDALQDSVDALDVNADVTDIRLVTQKLDQMIASGPTDYEFDAEALANAPTGEGEPTPEYYNPGGDVVIDGGSGSMPFVEPTLDG